MTSGNEEDIVDLYDWCSRHNLAAVPYGGGTSVVGGVNPPEHDRYRGTVTIDLKHFDKVLEVDAQSQSARIQAGVLGPSLEKQLKPTGLTLRFFLQAWEFSSLGGWIAPLDITSHGNTGSLNLPAVNPGRLKCLNSIFAKLDLCSALGFSFHPPAMLAPEFYPFRHQHDLASLPAAFADET